MAIRWKKRTDPHTWYWRMFTVEMVDGKIYDLTWWIYGFLFLLFVVIFG